MSGPQQELAPEREAVHAAQEVARRLVADRWPELAEVEPTMTLHRRVRPPQAVLQRAGVSPSEVIFTPEGAANEYTFTFTQETCTLDGHSIPRIARVTVDAQQRVVKATASK